MQIKGLKSDLNNDQNRVQQDKLKKKIDFMQANEALKYEKNQKNQLNSEMKAKERMNFFPFTHGDSIEKQ